MKCCECLTVFMTALNSFGKGLGSAAVFETFNFIQCHDRTSFFFLLGGFFLTMVI